MRHEPLWTHVSRKLVILLLAIAVPPAATLVWLGWHLLAADRSLLGQLVAERHQAEAQAVAHSLESALADAEHLLAGGPMPAGMARITMTPMGVTVTPADAVLWLPISRVDRTAGDGSFDDAEALEYGGAVDRAATRYEQLARSTNPATKAGGLVGLARVYQQKQQWDAAIDTYRRLAALGVNGARTRGR